MNDPSSSERRPGDALFVRPPSVETMRDPLRADWNLALGGDDAGGNPIGLIDFSLLNEIFENFLAVVGLPVAIIDLDGQVLASSRWQRLCMEFHRVNPGTLTRCLESDVQLSRDMAEGKSYAIYRCRNGLTDCATPIVVEGVHVANLFVGQFLLAPPDMTEFRRRQEDFGFEGEPYFKALSEVPIITEERLPAILTLMGNLARQIARQSLIERRVRASYALVEQQVRERTRELEASHERLHKIAARVPGVVFQFVRRPEGGYALPYASDAFAALFGVAPETVREDATPVFAAIHPDDLDATVSAVRISAQALTPWRHEFRVRRGDGTVRTLWGEAVPQREADGSVLWHGFITDVTARKRTETLLEARLRLAGLSAKVSLHDLLVATLDEACALTGSAIGFYHFLEADQTTLSLQAWSTATTAKFCQAVAENAHYDVEQAGVWADCVRLGRSVVYNDYPRLERRKGLPEGHAEVLRLMSVPIMRDGRIAAIIGVGNKPTEYDADDMTVVETLADMAWDLAERKRSDMALAERTELMQRRYEALRALNDIAALPRDSADAQLTQALTLGARHLGLPLGIISRIDGERYQVLHHHAPPAAGLTDGQTFILGDTYCALTLRQADVVAIAEMGRSNHAGHPCYKAFGLEAYIGAPVLVGHQPFGTVNFSSPEPFHREFDDGDLEFMRLLARWVGTVLEREQAEREIIAAKETAEQRASELACSNADLEQFAYVASHDLRQPLRMVNSYLMLIERRFQDRLDDEGRQFIAYARDGAVQMDKLIRDLLDYSRIGRHGEEPEQVDLAEAAAAAGHRLQVLIAETGAVVDLDTEPAVINGNRTELERLFQNLIGNAVKYRAADRAPQVTVRWRRQPGEWLVSVSDNGIGIDEEYWPQVFMLFRRLHGRQEYEGTGVGLAVCKKIVERHGGRIWIESVPNQGSTFWFTLAH